MKRTWTVTTTGYAPFPMILMDGPLDHAEALELARSIWPTCEVA